MTNIGIDISPTACRVMAKRLRAVCALPESECSGAPDAVSSSATCPAFDNSPAIHGWVHGSGMSQVPLGTKEIVCRPCGTDFMLMTFNTAINGWAIFSEDGFSTACRVMAKRLRDVCALPESEPLWRAGRGFVVRLDL